MSKKVYMISIFTIFIFLIILTNPDEDTFKSFIEGEGEDSFAAYSSIEVEDESYFLFSTYTPVVADSRSSTYLGFLGTFFKIKERQLDFQHQKINREDIEKIELISNGADPEVVSQELYDDFVKWFNEYPSEKIEIDKAPNSDKQLFIKMNNGSIVVSVANEKIFISRNDLGAYAGYYLLESNSRFQDLLNFSQDTGLLKTVFKQTFEGPDQKFVKLWEEATADHNELEFYLEKKFKSYFTENMYEEFLASDAPNFHIIPFKRGDKVSIKNLKVMQSEKAARAYDFTVDLEFVPEQDVKYSQTVKLYGEVSIDGDGKISNLDFYNLAMIFYGKNLKDEQMATENPEPSTQKTEIQMGDFIYRLVSEKRVYEADGPIEVYAELEYVGEQDEIEIETGVSPFYFPMYERTRGYEIDYYLPLPGRTKTLVKGEPLKEKLKVNGGYSLSSNYDHDYATFIISLRKDQFPAGHYEINGYARFHVKTNEKQEYFMLGQIDFKVQ